MLKKLLQLAQSLRRLYWWAFRPTTRGVRAIVVNSDGHVLLVWHRYQSGWFLPGGRTKGNEPDETALQRELREELGLSGVANPDRLGEYTNTYEHKRDTIVVFVVHRFDQRQQSHFEIESKQFFNPRELPTDVSPGTRRRIEEWIGTRSITSQW